MTKIIIANWKRHPETLEQAVELYQQESEMARRYPALTVVICPPTQFITTLAERDNQFLGAQDVFWQLGDNNYGVKFVLVGHSDQRYPSAGVGDSDEVVNQKLKTALASAVKPILLVGEKEQGEDRITVVTAQLTANLAGLTPEEINKVTIAYEPVWAISTHPGAEPDRPENALAAAKIVENITGKTAILYGGSVNQQNITDYLRYSQIAGAVIGGASLDAERWRKILEVVTKLDS